MLWRLLPKLSMGVLLGCLTGFSAQAEEGGSGAYTPGSNASIIDGMLDAPGFIIRANTFYYNAENHITCIPPSCTDVADVYGIAKAESLTLGWRPDIDLGKWAFMSSITVPFVTLDTKVDVPRSGPGATRLTDDAAGLGDIQLYPAILRYPLSDNLSVGARLAVFAPTGKYDASQLANFGKNYWSIMPNMSLTYFGKQNLKELSIYAGINFNTENQDTDYRSGDVGHVDFTMRQHYPLHRGLAGFGVTGYWYKQLTPDSGAGAVYGDYKASSFALGPSVSYFGQLGDQQVAIELKWLHDIHAKNRFQGDTVLLKYGVIF